MNAEYLVNDNVSGFELKESIDSDSMFLGENTSKGKYVAIKRCIIGSSTVFNNEKLKGFYHPNILFPFDVVKKENCIYALYRLSAGKSLDQYVKERGYLNNDEIKRIMKHIVSGCIALEKQGLCHRNIKPQNILIEGKNTMLCDFGLVLKTEDEPYTAPEITYSGGIPINQNDIWSIGAVMLFMYNGIPLSSKQKREGKFFVNNNITTSALDFLSSCMQYEVSKRISTKELLCHPYISELGEINKPKPSFIKPCPIERILSLTRYKFFKDIAYICYCDKEQDVVLKCQHSFCIKCFAKIRYISALESKDEYSHNAIVEKTKDPSTIIVECPKCLAYSEVINIKLTNDEIIKYLGNTTKKININNIKALTPEYELNNRNSYEELAVYGKVVADLDCVSLKDTTLSKMKRKIKMRKIVDSIEIISNAQNDILKKIIDVNVDIGRWLVRLQVKNCTIGDTGAILLAEKLMDIKSLRFLSLHNNYIGYNGIGKISELLKKNHTLTSIDLGRNNFNFESISVLVKAIKQSSITKLELQSCYMDNNSIKILVNGAERLTVLNISDCFLGRSGSKELEVLLRYSKTLRVLNINNCVISDSGLITIANKLKENCILTELYLNNNSLTSLSAQLLAEELKENKTLLKLHYDCNTIGTVGGIAMGNMLKYNRTLIELSFVNCRLTHEALNAIAEELKSNHVLILLDVSNNIALESVFTGKALNAIQKRLRQIKSLS